MRLPSFLLTLLALMFAMTANSAGLLTPVDQISSLKIKQHHVDVTINHSFAVIEIDQIFSNPHDQSFEAVYSFPVPENASVGEFTYWINGVPVHGEVFKKQRAKELYEQEKSAGRNAALIEQNSFIDFQMNISHVLPGEDVRVKLVYLQPVKVDHGIARFVYPLESGDTDEEQIAFWTANEKVEESFEFNLELNSSYPVDDIRMPAHPQAIIKNESEKQWQAALSNKVSKSENIQPMTLDQDIVVYWRLAQDLPGSIDLMTYRQEGADQGTFLMTLTPGNDLTPIEQGRDWIVVLDYSGSMQGKYDTLIRGVERGFDKFSPNDRVKVILFNGAPELLERSFTPAKSNDLKSLVNKLNTVTPTGGTNLYAALEMAVDELDSDRASAIWLVTDGVANIGETRQREFLSLLETTDVRLFTFIMGNGANRPLLTGLTRASNGFAVNVSNSDDIVGHLLNAASKVSHQAYRDINFEFKGVKVGDIQPCEIGSVYRGQQLVLMGHYWGEGELSVEMTAKIGSDVQTYSSQFDMPEHGEQFPELERMWAFSQIESLMQQQHDFGADEDREQAVTDLAIEYGLLTEYTSLLVLEEQVFEALNTKRRNADRIAKEHSAREIRQQNQLTSTRVDNNGPMFKQQRATHSNNKSSGGSTSMFMMILLIAAISWRQIQAFNQKLQRLS